MKKELPNIILIVCDTLGAKHTSLYGYERRTTPNLERLVAEEGFTAYTRCFAPGTWTPSSHASLFTGLYPSEHGCHGRNFFLKEDIYTLPEVLKENGYQTFGISNNVMVSPYFKFDRGFDKFYEMVKYDHGVISKVRPNLLEGQNKLHKVMLLINYLIKSKDINSFLRFFTWMSSNYFKNCAKDSTSCTRKTLKFAQKIISDAAQSPKPSFLFINFMQTHEKYNPPKGIKGIFGNYKSCYDRRHMKESWWTFFKGEAEENFLKHLEARYDEEVLFLDKVLYELFSYTKRTCDIDKCIFIITSDHGELFGEHGLFGHSFSTYNELIHIPLLIKFPGSKKPDLCSNLVQLNDLFATLMDIIGSPMPTPKSSLSLVSDRRKIAISQHIYLRYAMSVLLKHVPHAQDFPFGKSEMALITEDLWKIIWRIDDSFEIYDLNRDFYESKNLGIQKGGCEKAGELTEILRTFADSSGFKDISLRIEEKEVPEFVKAFC